MRRKKKQQNCSEENHLQNIPSRTVAQVNHVFRGDIPAPQKTSFSQQSFVSAALGPAEGYIAKFCKCAYLLHKPQILISMTGTSRDTTSQALVHLDKLCYRWAETLDILWSTKGSGLLQIPALSSHTGGTRHPPAVHRCMQVNQTILDYFKRRKNTLCESTFRWF